MDTRDAQRAGRPVGNLPIPLTAIGEHRFRCAVLAVKRYPWPEIQNQLPVSVEPSSGPPSRFRSRPRGCEPSVLRLSWVGGVFVERLQGVDHVVEPDNIVRSGHLPQSRHGFDGTSIGGP